MPARLCTVEEVVGPALLEGEVPDPALATGVAPEFRSLPVGQIQVFMDIAAQFVGPACGERRSMMHALLTAHLLTTIAGEHGLGGPGEVGPVTSLGTGPAAVGYASSTSRALTAESLAGSRYGQLYQSMRRLQGPFARSTLQASRRYAVRRW